MQLSEIIQNLSTIQARLVASHQSTPRPFLETLKFHERRSALVVGPRGVGKTSFLLRESIKHGNILYVTADHPIVATIPLWDLGEKAFLSGYAGLIVDEVHFAADWSRQLKSLYDSFPGKKIWASDSSSVILRRGTADLSRRFPVQQVPFLSFREYLALKLDIHLPTFDPMTAKHEAFEKPLQLINDLLLHFRNYLREGFRPIFLEGEYKSRLLAILEKTIMTDVPFFVPSTQDNHLRLMNAIIGHLALSAIPTINVDSLCAAWNVGKDKLYQLLTVMEEVGLIYVVRQKSDHKVSGKGAKILLADPSMYAALNGNIGNVREAFVVTACKHAGKVVFAFTKEEEGDFLINGKLVEVGGGKKKPKKADFVIRDDTERPVGNAIPLWSLGMMY